MKCRDGDQSDSEVFRISRFAKSVAQQRGQNQVGGVE